MLRPGEPITVPPTAGISAAPPFPSSPLEEKVYSNRQRFWPGLVLSLFAIMSSCWGLTRIRIVGTSETNGRVRCDFDSRWYFTGSVVLAALALVFALLQRWRLRHVA